MVVTSIETDVMGSCEPLEEVSPMPPVAVGVPTPGSRLPGAAPAGSTAPVLGAASTTAAFPGEGATGAAARTAAARTAAGSGAAAGLAELRVELLERVRVAAVRAVRCLETDLAEDLASWEAAGGLEAPPVEELYGLVPDPDCGPPDGVEAWLADLPGPLLFEYLDAVAGPGEPEPIVAGRLPRGGGQGCGFAAGGVGDELPPGAVLAGLAGDAWSGGLGRLTDDELIGVLRAGRRLASWAAALELAAVTDLAARREAGAQAAGDSAVIEHLGDEVAAALTLTGRAADELVDLAYGLERLPATAAALAAGRIDRCKAAVIAAETSGLSAGHAAAVEAAVLAADPAAAQERKERALREARVEKWDDTPAPPPWPGVIFPPLPCWPPITT